jgi:hypothetical protein
MEIISNGGSGKKFTVLMEYIAATTGHSKSTVRWSLTQLRDKYGIISTGDKENKGVPTELTELGGLLLMIHLNDKNEKIPLEPYNGKVI